MVAAVAMVEEMGEVATVEADTAEAATAEAQRAVEVRALVEMEAVATAEEVKEEVTTEAA